MKSYAQIAAACILLLLAISYGCLKDDPLNLPFKSFEPREIGDGHKLSDPAAENMDQDALMEIYRDVYEDENLWPLRSVLVFRNGKLVSEAYLKDENDITNRHLIWSCTKQVLAVIAGIAVDSGVIVDINDPISDYFNEELAGDPAKGFITIRNLVTMQSGIDYHNDGEDGQTDKILRQVPDHVAEYILGLPFNNSQGNAWDYHDGNPMLVASLLQKKLGRPLDEWAGEVFFSRIEMSNYRWMRYKDGVTLGAFGIETTPREFAKVALCVADSGRWKGSQVVSAAWIKDMLSTQIYTDRFGFTFGYYWWIDSTRNMRFSWGHGGQFAFILPDKALVIVTTSIPNTQGEYQIKVDEVLPYVDRIIDISY